MNLKHSLQTKTNIIAPIEIRPETFIGMMFIGKSNLHGKYNQTREGYIIQIGLCPTGSVSWCRPHSPV